MALEDKIAGGCVATTFCFLCSIIPAWITHVIVTILNEQWIFLFVGSFFFPIGVIHGWGVWFGVW
jgi:hypothetical protein